MELEVVEVAAMEDTTLSLSNRRKEKNVEDLIKAKSCDTVTISQERYEQLVALESRVNAAVDYIVNTDFCNVKTALRIMGFYIEEKKLKEKEKKMFDSSKRKEFDYV